MLEDTEAREMIRERRVQTARTHWLQPILSTNVHTQTDQKQTDDKYLAFLGF